MYISYNIISTVSATKRGREHGEYKMPRKYIYKGAWS